jgi:hypothetical protein
MCATVSWGAHESFIHPIFVLKNGCDKMVLLFFAPGGLPIFLRAGEGTPAEFKAAWSLLMTEFELQADQTLNTLYDIRADWVQCYFKDGYRGIMSSMQCSESVNHIIKKCHVDANTPLHLFAKQMIKFIHRRKMSEATEEYGCMVRTLFSPVQTCPEVLCASSHVFV